MLKMYQTWEDLMETIQEDIDDRNEWYGDDED